jgi:ferredoxin-NADP reductase/ferredoxin
MGSCARIAPEVFRLDPTSGLAEVVDQDLEPFRDSIIQAARACPIVAVEIDGVSLDEPISDALVLSVTPLAPAVVELRVRCRGYRFIPGQYAFVRFTDEKGSFYRTYSVVEATEGVVSFCVRVLSHGRGGKALASLKTGQRIGLSRASGNFALLTKDQPKLFITGGTGLAPVLPMLLAAPKAKKTVLFGGRSTDDFFYLDRLQSAPNTTVVLIASDPPPSWKGARGLVTHALEEVNLTDYAEAYASGSPGMVTAVCDRLVARGFPKQRIFSDAFEPGGPAATKVTTKTTTKATTSASAGKPVRTRDWTNVVRQVHFHASLTLALVFLFYAVTGFIANRVAWFVAEDTSPPTSSENRVPESVGLEQATLVPYLLGLLPPGTQPKAWKEEDSRSVATFVQGEKEFDFLIDHAERQFQREEWRQIPNSIDLALPTLVPWLNGRYPGEVDTKGIENDDASLSITIESVWGKHLITVNKEQRRLSASSIHPPLMLSLIDLHRGKHLGAFQRIIVDLAAVALIGLIFSGIVMGLVTPGRRRRITMAAVVVSFFVLLTLLTTR